MDIENIKNKAFNYFFIAFGLFIFLAIAGSIYNLFIAPDDSDNLLSPEEILISEVLKQDTITKYQEYLTKYPSGQLSSYCKEIINFNKIDSYLRAKPILDLPSNNNYHIINYSSSANNDARFLLQNETKSPFFRAMPNKAVLDKREAKYKKKAAFSVIIPSHTTRFLEKVSVSDGFSRRMFPPKVLFDNATNTAVDIEIKLFWHKKVIKKTLPPMTHIIVKFNLDSPKSMPIRQSDLVIVSVAESSSKKIIEKRAFHVGGKVGRYIFNINNGNRYNVQTKILHRQ